MLNSNNVYYIVPGDFDIHELGDHERLNLTITVRQNAADVSFCVLEGRPGAPCDHVVGSAEPLLLSQVPGAIYLQLRAGSARVAWEATVDISMKVSLLEAADGPVVVAAAVTVATVVAGVAAAGVLLYVHRRGLSRKRATRQGGGPGQDNRMVEMTALGQTQMSDGVLESKFEGARGRNKRGAKRAGKHATTSGELLASGGATMI